MGLEVVSRASRANVLATTPIRITDRRLHEFASLTPRDGYFFAS